MIEKIKNLCWRSSASRLTTLAVLLIVAVAAFMTVNNRGAWDFILPLRGERVLLLLLVSYAIGVSTLLFQTLTNNPILTPGILGFDALYILLQTMLVFFFGVAGFTELNLYVCFAIENVVMIGASMGLFSILMRYGYKDLTRMILIGVVFATLFRSFNTLMQRMLDPTVFLVLQTKQFAQFTSVRPGLLAIGAAIAVVSAVWLWKKRYELDVLMLGREHAISLGIHYSRLTMSILILIAVLVATATTLVGPVSFFGLLVCALVNALTPTMKHEIRLPMTVLLAAVMLVGGQFVFEQLLGMRSALSIVIEFLGGCVFLLLIFRNRPGRAR